MNCPICKESNISKLSSERITSSPFQKCNNCNIFFNEINNSIDYEHIFENYTKFLVEWDAGIPFFMFTIILLKKIIQQLKPDLLEPTLLDIGAGAGFTLDIANHFRWKTIGMEPSEELSLWGEKNFGVKILNTTLENSTILNKYDIIVLSEVIEHISDPYRFISRVENLIHDDGILMITTPNPETKLLEDSIGKLENKYIINQIFSSSHQILFSKKALHSMLKRFGFENIKIITVESESEDLRLIAFASKKLPLNNVDFSNIMKKAGEDSETLENLKIYLESKLLEISDNSVELWNGFSSRLMSIYNSRKEFSKALELGIKTIGRLEKLGYNKNKIIQNLNLLRTQYQDNKKVSNKIMIQEVGKLLHFSFGEFYFNYGMTLLQLKRFEEAEIFFELSHQIFNTFDIVSKSSWNKNDRKLNYLNEKFADNNYYIMSLQSAYHIALCKLFSNKQIEAIEYFNNILEYKDIPKEIYENILWNKGVAQLQSSNYSHAINTFEEITGGEFSKKVIEKAESLKNDASRRLILEQLEFQKSILSSLIEKIDSKYDEKMMEIKLELAEMKASSNENMTGLKSELAEMKAQTQIIDQKLITTRIDNIIKKQSKKNFQKEFNFGELNRNDVYEQEIFSEENNLHRIDIKMATFMRINNCNVIFSIKNHQGKLLSKIKISASQVKDNSFHPFVFEPISDSRNQRYFIEIESPNCEQNNSITFWCEKKEKIGSLKINSKKQNCSLIYKLFYKQN